MNISAVGIVFEVSFRVMLEILQCLQSIKAAKRNVDFAEVRKFVNEVCSLESIEFAMYSAMEAPKSDLFY